jgi:hypothetical protein
LLGGLPVRGFKILFLRERRGGRERTEEKGEKRAERPGRKEKQRKQNMCRRLFRLILAGSRGWRWMLFTARGRRALRRRRVMRRAMRRRGRGRRRPENEAEVEVEVPEPEQEQEQEQEPEPEPEPVQEPDPEPEPEPEQEQEPEPEPEPGAEQQVEVEPLPWDLNWQLPEMPLPLDWEPGQVPVPPVPAAQLPWVPAEQVPWGWDLDWVDPAVELEDEPDHEELEDFLVDFPNDIDDEDFLQLELEPDESANSTITTVTAPDVADDEAGDEEAANGEIFLPVEEAADVAADEEAADNEVADEEAANEEIFLPVEEAADVAADEEAADNEVADEEAANGGIFLAVEGAADEAPFPEEPFPPEEPPPVAAVLNPINAPSPGPAFSSSDEKIIWIRSGADLDSIQHVAEGDFGDKKVVFPVGLDQPLVNSIVLFCGNVGMEWEEIHVGGDVREEESVGSN